MAGLYSEWRPDSPGVSDAGGREAKAVVELPTDEGTLWHGMKKRVSLMWDFIQLSMGKSTPPSDHSTPSLATPATGPHTETGDFRTT